MEPNIPEVLRSTANNLNELFNMLANRIEALEKENNLLREQLAQITRDHNG